MFENIERLSGVIVVHKAQGECLASVKCVVSCDRRMESFRRRLEGLARTVSPPVVETGVPVTEAGQNGTFLVKREQKSKIVLIC